ncbi:GTP-binding protein, partial [uncultured Bilophila sp.]
MRKELIILSGFLGSGKTTLLRRLLEANRDRRIAVLLNDFGDVPVDGAILRRAGVEGGVLV